MSAATWIRVERSPGDSRPGEDASRDRAETLKWADTKMQDVAAEVHLKSNTCSRCGEPSGSALTERLISGGHCFRPLLLCGTAGSDDEVSIRAWMLRLTRNLRGAETARDYLHTCCLARKAAQPWQAGYRLQSSQSRQVKSGVSCTNTVQLGKSPLTWRHVGRRLLLALVAARRRARLLCLRWRRCQRRRLSHTLPR